MGDERRRTLTALAWPSRRRRGSRAAPWRSACYAPHASMYFDQFGKVRACCQNTGVYLGDVTHQRLREVWESASAEQMRSALDADDYAAGCEFCAWQVAEGNDEIVFARHFDHLRPDEPRPRWPRQMEFSLTNTCNLQCAMCNGDWSSTIRAKREGRDPLPSAYGDAFFEELAEFLPHLRRARFLGGEPFLGKEPLRVMEMLAALESPPTVDITTNGTVWTARVERVLEALRPDIVVSIDGASTATYDAIRVGAHLPDVLANLDRFIAQVGPDRVSIAHCLMTENWHEFADLLQLAEERRIGIGVNVVRFPVGLSLYQLPVDELREIVAALEATPVQLSGERLSIWTHHVAALRLHVEAAEAAPQPSSAPAPSGSVIVDAPSRPRLDSVAPWLPFAMVAPPDPDPHRDRAIASELHVALDGTIRVDVVVPEVVAADLRAFDGAHINDLGVALEAELGPRESWSQELRHEDGIATYRVLPPASTGVAMVCHAVRDEEGHLVGGTYRIHRTEPSP
ncbi:MAG: radical SAM protein [Acidimicrobiales bacterium]